MKLFITLLTLIISSAAMSAENGNSDAELYKGFNYHGEAINPKCVNLLQTWMSESPTYGVIVKSVVIDSCQNSNLGFEGRNPTVSKEGWISYPSDPKGEYSGFGYMVLAKSKNNIFALYHSGYVGLYRFEKQNMIFDFTTSEKKTVNVLTKLSRSWMPCFESAAINENKLSIIKHIWDSSKPRSQQCQKEMETLTFDLQKFDSKN